MVDIRRPGQNNGGVVKVEVEFDDPMFRARVRSEAVPIAQQAGAEAFNAARRIIPAEAARAQRYSTRLGTVPR